MNADGEMVAPVIARRDAPEYWPLGVTLLLLLGISVLVRVFDLDIRISSYFYDKGNWLYDDNALVQFFYHYGTWPTFVTSFIALTVWVSSYLRPAWQRRRELSGFIVLCMAVGPGLLINGIFKYIIGRPRPRDVIQFGGDHVFASLGEVHWLGEHHSFPSGHAAMGFFWLTLAIYFWNRQRRFAVAFAVLGVVQGGLMSLGRIVQGGHFFSDALWAVGVVYATSWLIYHLGPYHRSEPRG